MTPVKKLKESNRENPHQCAVQAERLVETVGRRHGSLDDKAAHVLPALLEQGDEVVDGKHDVGDELLLGHLDVADSDTHAENLLQLELDGGLDLGNLGAEVIGLRDRSRELAGCSDVLAGVLVLWRIVGKET